MSDITQPGTVVLVHGGFVDGSGWQGVCAELIAGGYRVFVTQHPTMTLEDDIAVVTRAIEAVPGPVTLVGHSYGGVVITEAGNHDKVTALAYIAAFAADTSESVASILADPAPGAPVPPILPPVDGFLFLDQEKFAGAFAADLPPVLSEFMSVSQVPWGAECITSAVTEPAWKVKPAWYLVAGDDRMIPTPVQRSMAERAVTRNTVEVPGASHAVYVSHPVEVADLIRQAHAN